MTSFPKPAQSARLFMVKTRRIKKQLRNLTRSTLSALLESYNEMLKKVALISAFFTLTPSLIIAAGLFLTLDRNTVKLPTVSSPVEASVNLEENHIDGQVLGAAVDENDVRAVKVAKFLKGTPLEPHSEYMVQISDHYGIDYRLIPAIAMKESGGGAAVDLASHNAWGFENGRTYFTSWEYAIDRVGHTLKVGYVAKGLVTPDQIMAKYAPPQLETGGKWAIDVNHFYEKIEEM